MPDRTCPTCETPVPEDAGFCPTCGEATPTQISDETIPTGERFIDSDELEYRHRLARALGDDYELRDVIGRGGFGVVYAAWDRKLDRDVAVKALRHDLFPTPMILQRLEREAKAVAKLRHPNILPIYSIGEGEGIAYMVMPLVEGESLRALMEREGKLPADEAIRIIVDVARALEVAHDNGFVHRDVKPENIMLDGKDRQVMLMDFGIAKAATAEETGLTGTGVIIGSPTYMSPEQARGETDIDHRADIYSLGAVAYELLSGERPYKAANTHELVYRQVTTKPRPLSKVGDVPANVSNAVMRSLEADRDDRWKSTSEFRSALQPVSTPKLDEQSARGLVSTLWRTRNGKVLVFLAVAGLGIFGKDIVQGAMDGWNSVDTEINEFRFDSIMVLVEAASQLGDIASERRLLCEALALTPTGGGSGALSYCGEGSAPNISPPPMLNPLVSREVPQAVRLFTRAMLYERRGNTEKALELYCQAIASDPEYTTAQRGLADLAQQVAPDSVPCDPSLPSLLPGNENREIPEEAVRLYTRSMLYEQRGDTARSVELLCQVTAQNPQYAEAQQALTRLGITCPSR